MSYEPWAVIPGVYKHHTGSSVSSSSQTWIYEIRKAWNMLDDGNPLADTIIHCAAAGCRNNSTTHRFEGCHLTESRLKEFLAIFGIGGTPVVALCSSCHDKYGGAIRIGTVGMGIIDKNCPPDFTSARNSQNIDGILCENCRTDDTKGPDSDGDYFCSTCNHHINQNGECVTGSCCTAFKDDGAGRAQNGYCSCNFDCSHHYKSRCPQLTANLCFQGMCGTCCDGTDCLRHSEHEKYGRPGIALLKKLNKKTKNRQPYEDLRASIEKKFSDGPLRSAEPICRECGELLFTPSDDDWRCVNRSCSLSSAR
jgi:hypothetical protein